MNIWVIKDGEPIPGIDKGLELLGPLEFTIGREEYIVDRESLAQIQENTSFKVDSMFSLFSPEELCTVSLRILLKKQCEYKDKS